jgi:hypothetical protein
VRITAYRTTSVELRVELARPSVVVLSDSIYAGWGAEIGGKPTRVMRANGLFRAVAVPAGTHTILFAFRPAPVIYGFVISLLSLIGTCLLIVIGTTRRTPPVSGSGTRQLAPLSEPGDRPPARWGPRVRAPKGRPMIFRSALIRLIAAGQKADASIPIVCATSRNRILRHWPPARVVVSVSAFTVVGDVVDDWRRGGAQRVGVGTSAGVGR